MAAKIALAVMLAEPILASTDEPISELTHRLEEIRREHDVPGFAVTLVHTGGVLTATGGLADRASARPVTADTLFRIGPVTKTFDGIAFLMLAEEDRFDLDAPLRQLVPEAPLHNPWSAAHPLRISHVLEHTA
jgi:CubicO group peptidase (beta-lactamase class C family)